MVDNNKKGEKEPKRKNRTIQQQLADNRCRADKIKDRSQKELRKKLKGSQYLVQLGRSYKQYEQIYNELRSTKQRKVEIQTGKITKRRKEELLAISIKLDCLKLQIDVVKAKVDLNLKRLRFVLPELKAVEIDSSTGSNPLAVFATAVAAMSEI